MIEEVQDSTLSGRGVEPGGHIPTMAQQLPIQISLKDSFQKKVIILSAN